MTRAAPDTLPAPRIESRQDSPPTPAITVRSVTQRFVAAHDVLQGIDLDVASGEFVSLIGASGCGKTTLLRLVAGLDRPTLGQVTVFGGRPQEASARHWVGVAFQRAALIPSRTALENVRLTAALARDATCLDPAQLLRDFGLGEAMDRFPAELSGGMQQRVSIAAAMVHQPRLLLLDEPFGALDELTREAMIDWLAGVLERRRPTTLLVTHSVEEAVALSDRVLVLSRNPGRIAADLRIPLPRPRPRLSSDDPALLAAVREVRAGLRAVLKGGDS
jgi:NitT/TauT family transport system ATP-binding protein